MAIKISAVFILLSFVVSALAFLPPRHVQGPPTARLSTRTSMSMKIDRRELVSAMSRNLLIAGLGGVMLTMKPLTVKAAEPAPLDDLAPPTPQEIEQERVRAKLKRQQQAAGNEDEDASSRSYGDSLKREREKQQKLNKGKQQRREDLCEKLGRGC